MKRPEVTKYFDFRLFLKDWALYCQSRNPRWSYGVWARKMGLSSKSSLIMVLSGKRSLGPRMLKMLLPTLELSESEGKYFERLVAIQKSNLEKFFRVSAVPGDLTESAQTRVNISRWLTLVLRVFISFPQFREDHDWVGARIGMPIDRAVFDDAIEALLSEGLLLRLPNGKLTASALQSASNWSAQDVIDFHRAGMEAGQRSIVTDSRDQRAFYSSFLRVQKSRIVEATELIQKFRQEFEKLFEESGHSDAIYQLNLQFYPVADATNEKSAGSTRRPLSDSS